MNTKLKNYLEQKDKRTWFYYHLKRDKDFKKEAELLKEQITLATINGPYVPTSIQDFKYLNDPNAEQKIKKIKTFMQRWNIDWDYSLLNFLIDPDENKLPPMFKAGFALGTNEERNMFDVQIPVTVQREDLDYLWLMLKAAKKAAGIDVTKKPRKATYTSTTTEIAYEMWKRRTRGMSWTKIVREINELYQKHFFDIKSAQRHLKAYGINN